MNISGVLVHANPKQVDEVETQLKNIAGVEIHAITEDGRFIVTVEEEDDNNMANTVLNLHRCQGVLSAVMVYQYSNDDENFDEVISI